MNSDLWMDFQSFRMNEIIMILLDSSLFIYQYTVNGILFTRLFHFPDVCEDDRFAKIKRHKYSFTCILDKTSGIETG